MGLEREIADLKARWPKHSPLLRHRHHCCGTGGTVAVQAVSPAMLMRLEGLEELERLRE